MNGPRAVAMGLVGAIVVRPADFGTGADGPRAGVPSRTRRSTTSRSWSSATSTRRSRRTSTPPSLGTTFDLRNFHSTYRLINGVAYPNVPSITTTAGNKVLLRYLNAGVLGNAMGPVGARQQVVAIDGYPSSAGALVADILPPGQTEDVHHHGGRRQDARGPTSPAGWTTAGPSFPVRRRAPRSGASTSVV